MQNCMSRRCVPDRSARRGIADERSLPRHPFRRFRDAPVAAFAGHVSEAVHPLQSARSKPARRNLAKVDGRTRDSSRPRSCAIPITAFWSRRTSKLCETTARAIILEPVARNTAGAIAVGCAERGTRGSLRHHRRHAVGSCHADADPFSSRRCSSPAEVAASGAAGACSGSHPTVRIPATAISAVVSRCEGFDGSAFKVEAFAEKPDAVTAQLYRRAMGTTSGTAASSCCTPGHSSTSWRSLAPTSWSSHNSPSIGPRKTSAFCGSTAQPSRSAPISQSIMP